MARLSNFAQLTQQRTTPTGTPVNTAPTVTRAPAMGGGDTTPPTTTAPAGRTQAQWLLDMLNAGTAPQTAIDTLNNYGGGFAGAAYYNDQRGQTIGLNSVNGYLNKRTDDGSWELVMRPNAEGGPKMPNNFGAFLPLTGGLGAGLAPPLGTLPMSPYTPMAPPTFAPLPPAPFGGQAASPYQPALPTGGAGGGGWIGAGGGPYINPVLRPGQTVS